MLGTPSTRLLVKPLWLLRRGITLLLGLPLLYLVSLMGAFVAGAAAFAVTLALGKIYSPSLAWDCSVAVVSAGWAGLYGAIPTTRFLLRLFPMRADERRRWGVMTLVALTSLGTIAAVAWLRLHPDQMPTISTVGGPQSFVVGMTVTVVQMLVMLHTYGAGESKSPEHMILYLRRFRSFSDRVVYRFLLSAMPVGARVTVLVPVHGGARDLDPFTIGFAGLRWRWPLAAIPHVLVSPEDAWQGHVIRLLQDADTVVVDGSAESASMAFEYGLIERLCAGPRTLLLVDASATGRSPTFSGATVLAYRRDAWAALRRGLLWLFLFGLYALLATREPVYYPISGLLGFLLILPALFQKSMHRESVQSLRRALKQRVGPAPNRPARVWRAVAASIVLGALPYLAVLAANGYYKPLPATDPTVWAATTGPMSGENLAVGKQIINTPVPAGFFNPKDVLTRFRKQDPRMEPLGVRTIATFTPADHLVRSLLDDRAVPNVVMTLYIGHDLESELMDEAIFAALHDASEPPEAAVLPRGVTNPRLLASGQRFISRAMDVSLDAERSGRRVHLTKSCTNNIVLVRGKALIMTLCRDMESARDAPWVRAMTSHWIEDVLRRNPAMPPRPNALGMSGNAEVLASIGLSGAGPTVTMQIDEVFPGSPAALAGLHPGDKIVAINGAPIRDPGELKLGLERLPSGAALPLTVERDNASSVVALFKP